MYIIAVKIHEDTRSYLQPFMKYCQEPYDKKEYEHFLNIGKKGKGGYGFHECLNFKVTPDGYVRFYLPLGYIPSKRKRRDNFAIVWVSYEPHKILGIQYGATICGSHEKNFIRDDSTFTYYKTPLCYHGFVDSQNSILFNSALVLKNGRHIPKFKAWGNGLRYLNEKHLNNIIVDRIRALRNKRINHYERLELRKLEQILKDKTSIQKNHLPPQIPDKELGLWGEKKVYQDQIRKMIEHNLQEKHVIHTSQIFPHCEYDIESINFEDDKRSPLYIEVKTTQNMERPSILISDRQIQFAEKNKGHHLFAFVDAQKESIRYLNITELRKEFELNPEKYRLYRKKGKHHA